MINIFEQDFLIVDLKVDFGPHIYIYTVCESLQGLAIKNMQNLFFFN